MFRYYLINFKDNWDDHFSLIEFAYNNSYLSNIQMTPFEAIYGRKCRSPIGWFDACEISLICPEVTHEAMEKVYLTR